MGSTAMILGHKWQKQDENTIRKIESAIKTAVDDYHVTDFYFGNEDDDASNEENLALKELFPEDTVTDEFIAQYIKEYKKTNSLKEIRTSLVVARVTDTNYKENLFDDIIQGYPLYYRELDCKESSDAYLLRDNFLIDNVDCVFWYSNRILGEDFPAIKRAKPLNKIVVFL